MESVSVQVRIIESNCTQERITVTRKGFLLPAYWTIKLSETGMPEMSRIAVTYRSTQRTY